MRMRGLVLLMLAGIGGCYEYRTYDAASVHAGQTVRVALTPSASTELAASIGPSAALLDGRVVDRSGAGVTLALTQITRSAGSEEFLHDEPLSLPLGNVSAWRVRSLDRPRTALVIGGIVAAVVAGRVFLDQSGVFSARGAVASSTK